MDLNDWLGQPFVFVIGSNNTFQNINANVENWDRDSTKYSFAVFIDSRGKRTK